MKVYLDCFPCFMRQGLEAARMATDDVALQREVLDRVAQLLPAIPMDATPVDMGQLVHRTVREVTGVPDPYQVVKKRSNDLGLTLYPELKGRVERSEDRLLTAVKIAGAGNIIDFGPKLTIDLKGSVEEALAAPINESAYRAFKEKLGAAEQILYLGDNAGEIVCDKILIEEFIRQGKDVTFAVRGRPVLNDVTLEDATYVGLDSIASVITTGSDAPGVALRDVSSEFLEALKNAPLVIAKGQGNFEGLSNVAGPIFFLFKVKCPVVARETGVKIGEVILKEQKNQEGD